MKTEEIEVKVKCDTRKIRRDLNKTTKAFNKLNKAIDRLQNIEQRKQKFNTVFWTIFFLLLIAATIYFSTLIKLHLSF